MVRVSGLDSLVDRVRLATDGDAHIPGSAIVVVGVSGGKDSVALLHLLAVARPDLQLVAAHVRHGLRDDTADAAAAAAAAAALGVGHEERRVTVVEGRGPEDAARQARWRALGQVAGEVGASHVAVGHTMDDQAETVLLRIARGTGVDGLAGMSAKSLIPVPQGGAEVQSSGRVVVVRPLLGERRADVRRACAGYETVEDPTNADPDQRRARVRAEALPALRRLHPSEADVVPLIARLADFARDASIRGGSVEMQRGGRSGRRQGDQSTPAAVVRDRPEEEVVISHFGFAISIATVGSAPLHADEQVLRQAWAQLHHSPTWPGRGLLDRLQELGPDERCDLPGGVRATRVAMKSSHVRDRLVLCPVSHVTLPRIELPEGADVHIPGFGWLSWEQMGAESRDVVDANGPDLVAWAGWTWTVELPLVGSSMAVRGRHPQGERDLRRILQRYPEPLRGQVPLLVDQEDRVLMAGPRVLARATGSSTRRMTVVARPGSD